MENGLPRDHGRARPFAEQWTAGVEVAVPLREVTRRDRHSNRVPCGNFNANRAQWNVVAIDAVRLYHRRIAEALAVSRPHDPLLEIDGTSVGKDLAQSCGPVRVASRGRGEESDTDVTDQLHRFCQ